MNKNVVIIKRACRICHTLEDSEILLNTRYDKNGNPDQCLEEYDGKTIGYIEGGKCETCKEESEGHITLIGIDPDKGETNNPYLIGEVAYVKENSEFGKMLLEEHKDKIINDKIFYMDKQTFNFLKDLTK